MNDFLESLRVCVAYLCTRMEEIEKDVLVNDIHIADTDMKQIVTIGRDLVAAIEAVKDSAVPQDLLVQFTDSECEPQDI